MIIDCHGHFTNGPPKLGAWRKAQLAAIGDSASAPKPADLKITDDEIRALIERLRNKQLHESEAEPV